MMVVVKQSVDVEVGMPQSSNRKFARWARTYVMLNGGSSIWLPRKR